MNSGRTIFAILLVCSRASAADAGTYVRISQPAGMDGSGTSCSSGTLIGWTTDCARGIFLSCAHGYDTQRPVAIQLDSDHQTSVEGRFLAIDRDLELSLIAAPVSRSTEMLRLAERSPHACDRVRLIGYPDKNFRDQETCITGRFWSRDACTTRWTLYEADPCCLRPEGYHELLVTAAASAPGLSGGAVVRNRKLVGVVVGRITNANDVGLIVPGETVKRFVCQNIALFYCR